MSEYKCNFVIAGIGKSGTSSLHSYLDAHPEICMSSTKEPHYFSIDAEWKKGPNFHNRLFSDSKPRAIAFGESSTTYSSSEIAMKRIKSSIDNPRVIVVLRDPVERVISHYRWVCALGLEDRPFLQAIEESGYDFDPNLSVQGRCYMSYLEFSIYSKWIPKLQEIFGSDNVLILRADDLKDKPALVVNACCSFLGVSKFVWDLPAEQNKTEDVLINFQYPAVALIRTGIPSPVRRLIKSIAPTLVKLLNKMSMRTRKMVLPKITDEERNKVAIILSKELEYYMAVPHVSQLQVSVGEK